MTLDIFDNGNISLEKMGVLIAENTEHMKTLEEKIEIFIKQNEQLILDHEQRIRELEKGQNRLEGAVKFVLGAGGIASLIAAVRALI